MKYCVGRRLSYTSTSCRVGREVSHPGPSPDPDKEMSTIRLFRRCDSWLHPPDPDRDPWVGQRLLSQETPKVATDAEGVAVTAQTSTERGVLGLNRLMPMASTPVVDGLLGPSQARPPRLAPPKP